MKRFFRPMFVALAGIMVIGIPTSASDPLGVYCLVEKVVLEPTDCPERAQVWGACVTSNPRQGGDLTAVRRGYFYYKVPARHEDLARAEWKDLQSVAGKQIAVGFGKRNANVGRFRAPDMKPETPDDYPINIGVVRLYSDSWAMATNPNLMQQLQTALGRR